MRARFLIPLALISLGTACGPFPDLGQVVSAEARAADYPTLQPLPDLSERASQVRISPEVTRSLDGRVAALRARAARLQRPVVEASVKARMRAALARRR